MRCKWAEGNELLKKYHDEEWGTPVHDDQILFEHLILDCFQAGLSWQTVLNKRENFRLAFDNFNIKSVAEYGPEKVEELLQNKGIIRNRLKIEASINNAQQVIKVQEEFGSFDSYIWQFTKGETITNHFKTWKEIPATTELSDEISKALKKRGFKFVGSTIIYAIMQAHVVVEEYRPEACIAA